MIACSTSLLVSPYRLASSAPIFGWPPSISWSAALPTSCSRPQRRAGWPFRPPPSAPTPHRGGASPPCCPTFCLYPAPTPTPPPTPPNLSPPPPPHGRLLSPRQDVLLHLRLRLLHPLLDARRVDAAVLDQLRQGQPGGLAADVVEGADDDHAGGVVHDHVHAGRLLEGADVPPLAA